MCNNSSFYSVNIVVLCYTLAMQQLLIKYRFEGLPYIVADGKGNFFQLAHCTNKYTKQFRQLQLVLNNGITSGYRINRKFISLNQLRKKSYTCHEVVNLGLDIKLPF